MDRTSAGSSGGAPDSGVQTVSFNHNLGIQTALDILMDPESSPVDIQRAQALTSLSREVRIAKGKSSSHYRGLEYKVYPEPVEPEPVGVTEHDLPSEEDFAAGEPEGRDEPDYDTAEGDEGFSSANLT